MSNIVTKADRKHSALQKASIILDQRKQQAIFIVLFAVLYLLRDLIGLSIPDVVFSGLCAVAFMLTDAGTALGIYIFTTALTAPHNEIRIIYLGILLVKMLYSDKVRVNGLMLIMTFGMLFLQLINNALFSESAIGTLIYDYVTRMLIVVIPAIWYDGEYTAEDYQSALLCYVAGVMLGGTVVLLLTANELTWEVLLKGTGGKRLGTTVVVDDEMQTSYNANQLSGMFAIAVAILLGYMDRKRMSKVFGVALVGYSMFIVALTRSRSGVLLMGLIALTYYLVLVVRRNKLFSGLVWIALVGILVLVLMKLAPGVVDAVLNRFVDQEDITNGRSDIFAFFIEEWVREPWCFLFGYGIGSYKDAIGIKTSPHNAITDILISWGTVGLLLVFWTLMMCGSKKFKQISKKDRIMAYLPATVAFVYSMAGQYLTVGYPHMRLCFLLLAAQAFIEGETNLKNE